MIRLLFKFIKPYWFFALTAPLMMLVEVFMDLMFPAIMARIVDEGIASHNLNLVFTLGLRMLIVTVIGLTGGASCSYLASRASSGLGADLRLHLFTKVNSLSHKNMDQLETGNLIIRLTNDVGQIEETTQMILRIMVRTPLQILGSLIMAIAISRQLSSLFIVFVPLLLLVIAVLIKISYPLFYTMQSRLDHMNTRIQENLAGKRLVKAFVREDFEIDKFNKTNEALTDITISANRAVSLMNPAMQLLLYGGIIAALWFGAGLIDTGFLKVGALIAFINYLRQLLFSLMMFSNVLMRFSRAQASALRIQEVLDSKAAIRNKKGAIVPGKLKGKIEFRNASFSYRKDGDPVLKNISFTINPGESVALIGATGSGKSSIARMIPRFYDLNSGEILIDDQSIDHFTVEELRKQIALVPQQTILFAGSIRENILFHYPQEQHAALDELMQNVARTANIASFIEALPEGYDTDIHQRGVNLSGGQKQRIAIARALAKQAPIIIFDDATSAVDMETEKHIYQALKYHEVQSSMLIIAQRISSIMNADTILILDDGEISGAGTHEELLKFNSIYREIYHSQIDQEIQA